jgi:hypothetical protein
MQFPRSDGQLMSGPERALQLTYAESDNPLAEPEETILRIWLMSLSHSPERSSSPEVS